MSEIQKVLVSGDIQIVEMVLTLALACGVDKINPLFIEKLRSLRAAFDADLVAASEPGPEDGK